MKRRRDPVESRSGAERDLYEVSTWEPRSVLDRFAVAVYRAIGATTRAVLVLLGVAILLAQLVLGGLGVLADPVIGLFVVLSVVPALLLAIYVWYTDVTPSEPLSLLIATFVLGVLFAGFAAVLNAVFSPISAVSELFGADPVIGLALFFFLVVGPVEELVKLLAIRLYAYRDKRFDAVIDGAVYGAVAGLGFATIENAVYIAGSVAETADLDVVAGGTTATVRALAGPGHVLYSAIAGYYLGLAKFNPRSAGPIVVKGLVIAALIHGLYNTLVSSLPEVIATTADVSHFVAFLAFVVVYDGAVALFLFRKIFRYQRHYDEVSPDEASVQSSELTEFEP